MTAQRQTLLIQLLLREFPQGLRKKDILQFLGASISGSEDLLQKMLEDRLIEYSDSTFRWTILKLPRVQDCMMLDDSDDSPNAERCLHLLARGEKFSACLQLHAYLQKLAAEPAIHGVSVCLDILIGHLRNCPYEDMDAPALRKYLELLLNVQGDSFSLGVRMRLAHTLSSVSYAVAEMLGDERTRALINIMDGCLRYHSGTEAPRSMDRFLDEGLSAIEALGDIDIETQVKYFLSFLYYAKGDFKSCYASFDAAQEHLHAASFQYFNTLYPIYLALAANRLNQYAQSIGVCTGMLREAKRNKDRYKELWLTAILAVQFLQIGANAKGLSLLSEILDCTDADSSPKFYLWVWRALALYHSNTGRLDASHRIMTECMHKRIQQGLGRFIYSAEWILELLERYRKKNLPPVPEYELEREVERILTRQDRHLHGMAFRVKARLTPKEDLKQRINLLQCSCEAFQESGNRREAARSSLLLAQYYLADGRREEAGTLRAKARAVLMETTLRPARLLSHLAPWQGLVYAASAVQDSLDRCFSLIRKLDFKLSAEAYTSQMLNAVQRELGAESAMLCRLQQNGSPQFIAGCNTSEHECGHWRFGESIKALTGSSDQDWMLTPSHDALLLSLRIDSNQKEPLFLFLESSYVAGAFASLTSADIKALQSILKNEIDSLFRLESRHQEAKKPHGIEYVLQDSERLEYDDSPGYMRILEQAKHAAQTDAPILILGETGVGKEVLARQIHQFSGRSGMFVPVHPASTPENLFESEFFGYEKGAFTGAHKQKIGFFELADNGTFFIDELAEIPMSFQIKLLRVLQDHSFTRVGGIRYITSNFRLVAATNKNLWQEVQEGRFREDLYYRLSVIPIKIPPLRKRQQDIPRLLSLFIQQYSTRYGRKLPPITDELIEQCTRYPWPGNIREMKNIVERAVILNTGGPLKLFLSEYSDAPAPSEKNDVSELYADLPTLEELSIRYMQYVLEKTKGRIIGPDGAESILGVKRSTLYAKLRKYGLK